MNDIHKVKRAWENYKATGEVRILSEGTWSAPQTVEQARELAELMKAPIPVSVAADKLYNLMGDDDLFDTFYDVEEKDGLDADVRYFVAAKLDEWISVLGTDEDPGWRDPWNKQAIRIIRNTIAKFA